MARLRRRNDGEYIVVSAFERHGRTLRCTYQVEDEALERLARQKVREDDHIPDDLFFELLRDGLLYTNKTGPGAEPDDGRESCVGRESCEEKEKVRKIPLDVTDELLQMDGSFLSFGAFLLRYRGPGRTDNVLRQAYRTLKDRYSRPLRAKVEALLQTHMVDAIHANGESISIELVPR
jgi:hypothetical protein